MHALNGSAMNRFQDLFPGAWPSGASVALTPPHITMDQSIETP